MFGSRIAYTVFMILATILAGVLLRRRQQRLPLEAAQKWGIAIGGLIGATIAAKAPFIMGADPSVSVMGAWLSDGKTILWGLAGGYLGVEVAKWALLVKTSTGDSFVIPVAIAIAIGRIGCLLFGCCFGIPTNQNWGISFVTAPDGGTLLRHPAQVYEMIFHVSFATIAWAFMRRSANQRSPHSNSASWMRGNWMPIYLVAYASYRFFSEFVRPEKRIVGGLTFYQWSAIAIGVGFVGLLTWRLTRAGVTPLANQLPPTTRID